MTYSATARGQPPIGRDSELAVGDRFLDALSHGSSYLILDGEPGIGKTTIWTEICTRAVARGYTVLAARPVQSETDLPFAGLLDLLAEHAEDVLPSLPGPQRRALEVALLRTEPGAGPGRSSSDVGRLPDRPGDPGGGRARRRRRSGTTPTPRGSGRNGGITVLDAVSISADRPVPAATIGVSVLAQPAAPKSSAAAPLSRPAEPTGASAWIAMVFEEHGSRIHGMILAATRDADVAAEVTQEAFLRLLREAQADRYPAITSAWLYRTAMNLAISRIRRAAVAQRLAPRLACGDEALMREGIVLDRERWRAIGEALSHLSPTERTALVMAGQGNSGEEIAAHLGKSHGATRSLMVRARGRLRRHLEGLTGHESRKPGHPLPTGLARQWLRLYRRGQAAVAGSQLVQVMTSHRHGEIARLYRAIETADMTTLRSIMTPAAATVWP